jgi:hypothetical protein
MSWSIGTGKVALADAEAKVRSLSGSQGGMDELQPLVDVQMAAAKDAAALLLAAVTERHSPNAATNVTVSISGHVNNNDASAPESISVYINVQE